MKKLLYFVNIFVLAILFTNPTLSKAQNLTRAKIEGKPDCPGSNFFMQGIVCPTGTTYTISNPNNYQVRWEVVTFNGVYTDEYLAPSSGSGNSLTFYPLKDGNVAIHVYFFVDTPQCNDWFFAGMFVVKAITSNTSNANFSILGNSTSNFLDNEIYTVSQQNDLNYTWTVPQGWQIVSGQGTNTIEVLTGLRSGQIRATRIVCGLTKTASKSVTVNSGNQPLRVFPNSSDGLFNIAIEGEKELLDLQNATIEVLNSYGISVYNEPYNASNTSIDLRKLGAGIYALRFASKDFVWVTKVIIQK
jgi:hypothetical protein